jgi:hypothetical protein
MSLLESITPSADTLAVWHTRTAWVCGITTAIILLWDAGMCVLDQSQNSPTVSHVLRKANALSGGLVALLLLGVWVHLFLHDWLPTAWREP